MEDVYQDWYPFDCAKVLSEYALALLTSDTDLDRMLDVGGVGIANQPLYDDDRSIFHHD